MIRIITKFGCMIVILCMLQSTIKLYSADDVALPTQLLKVIRLNGLIELNCDSDEVFNEIYKLFSEPQTKERFFNIVAERPTTVPAISFSWNNLNTSDAMGGKIVINNPTLWVLLEKVCEKRNRQLVDFKHGVVFLTKDRSLLDVSEVVIALEQSEVTQSRLSNFTPKALQIYDTPNNGKAIDILNAQLKLASKLGDFSEVIQIKTESALLLENRGDSPKYATFLGRWRYVDFFQVYGSIFFEKFTIGQFTVSMLKMNPPANQ